MNVFINIVWARSYTLEAINTTCPIEAQIDIINTTSKLECEQSCSSKEECSYYVFFFDMNANETAYNVKEISTINKTQVNGTITNETTYNSTFCTVQCELYSSCVHNNNNTFLVNSCTGSTEIYGKTDKSNWSSS